MLYDLNVPWTPSIPHQQLGRTVDFLSSLGYHTLALNYHVSAVSSQISNPIPLTHPFRLPPNTVLLRRCTFILNDPSQNHRLSQLASAYDILALRPTNEKAFLAACLNISEHSIISLDLTQHFPFHFKPTPLMAAVKRGIRIEICYSQATIGDAAARRNFIGNTMSIMRATKGRGLVVSSGAEDVLGTRGPADVVNLLGVWGLGRERATEGLGVNPRGVVINEGLKRSGFRGVIDVVYGGEKNEVEEASTESKNDKGKKHIQIQAGKLDRQSTPLKRKAPENLNADGTPHISKRQAKRLRLEALKAAKDGASSPSQSSNPITEVSTSIPPEQEILSKTIKGAATG